MRGIAFRQAAPRRKKLPMCDSYERAGFISRFDLAKPFSRLSRSSRIAVEMHIGSAHGPAFISPFRPSSGVLFTRCLRGVLPRPVREASAIIETAFTLVLAILVPYASQMKWRTKSSVTAADDIFTALTMPIALSRLTYRQLSAF